MESVERIIRTQDELRSHMYLLSGIRVKEPLLVTISNYKKKRSTNQNSLYWKWLMIVSNDSGQDVEDLHEIFKRKFLGMRLIKSKDGNMEVPKSTADLNTKEMTDYMDRVHAFVSSAGFALPVYGPEEKQ